MNLDFVATIFCSVLASSGLWALISKLLEKKSKSSKLLVGLAHDRIVYLGEKYIERGSITKEEYENLVDYLYKPYKELGGNGTAERVIQQINKLPWV